MQGRPETKPLIRALTDLQKSLDTLELRQITAVNRLIIWTNRYTQSELADAIGITRAHFNQIVNRSRKLTKIQAAAILAALGGK